MCFLLDLSVLLKGNLNVETGLSACTTQKGLQAHPVPGLVSSVRPSHEAKTCAVLPGEKGNHDTGPRLGEWGVRGRQSIALVLTNRLGKVSQNAIAFARDRVRSGFRICILLLFPRFPGVHL
jgi:hypothetical protein